MTRTTTITDAHEQNKEGWIGINRHATKLLYTTEKLTYNKYIKSIFNKLVWEEKQKKDGSIRFVTKNPKNGKTISFKKKPKTWLSLKLKPSVEMSFDRLLDYIRNIVDSEMTTIAKNLTYIRIKRHEISYKLQIQKKTISEHFNRLHFAGIITKKWHGSKRSLSLELKKYKTILNFRNSKPAESYGYIDPLYEEYFELLKNKNTQSSIGTLSDCSDKKKTKSDYIEGYEPITLINNKIDKKILKKNSMGISELQNNTVFVSKNKKEISEKKKKGIYENIKGESLNKLNSSNLSDEKEKSSLIPKDKLESLMSFEKPVKKETTDLLSQNEKIEIANYIADIERTKILSTQDKKHLVDKLVKNILARKTKKTQAKKVIIKEEIDYYQRWKLLSFNDLRKLNRKIQSNELAPLKERREIYKLMNIKALVELFKKELFAHEKIDTNYNNSVIKTLNDYYFSGEMTIKSIDYTMNKYIYCIKTAREVIDSYTNFNMEFQFLRNYIKPERVGKYKKFDKDGNYEMITYFSFQNALKFWERKKDEKKWELAKFFKNVTEAQSLRVDSIIREFILSRNDSKVQYIDALDGAIDKIKNIPSSEEEKAILLKIFKIRTNGIPTRL